MASAAAPAPSVRALNCPACGGALELRAAGYSVTVACRYCSSVLDVANPDVRLITRYEEAARQLEIPLGTRGTLDGVEWEVIGYLTRSEHGSYSWEEYLLFNPYHGYRWLVTNGRGWSFAEMLTRAPGGHARGAELDGHSYEIFFSSGQAQVDYVLGEFYWRVQFGEEVVTDDYVRPGWMLSREANETEVSWSLSRLLHPKEMERAFGIAAPAKPWPPLPHQPSPYVGPIQTGLKVALAAFGFLLLIALFFGGGATLLEKNLPVPLSGQSQPATLGPIAVTRPYRLVAIRAYAPGIDNAWIDLDYALVDRATDASYEAYGLAEHYSGRDSDGPWQEGSRARTVKLAAVPRGTYDLVVDFSGNRWPGSSYGYDAPSTYAYGQPLSITVSQGSVFPSNLLLAFILLFAPVLVLFVLHVRFEKARQAESDVGPTGLAAMFNSSDEDDE